MIRKSTWVVFGVFIVLALAAIFLRWSPTSPLIQSTATPASTPAPYALGGIQSVDISAVRLESAEGIVKLVRNPDLTWTRNDEQIVEAGKVEELLANLVTTRVLSQLAPDYNTESLALNPPAQSIFVQTTTGEIQMAIGADSPTGSGTYLKIDDQPAIVVSKYAIEAVLTAFNNAVPSTPTPAVDEVTPAP